MPRSKRSFMEEARHSLNCAAGAFATLSLFLAGAAISNAEVVSLKNPTATLSMSGGWNVNLLTDGTTNDVAGWSGYNTSVGAAGAETSVFETETDAGFASGSVVKFTLFNVNHNPQHTLGRFRLSYTTDSRDTFADGLNSGGDVVANWIVVVPKEVTATGGATLSILEDGSILAGGGNPDKSIYTVVAETIAQGITGFRLEALEDPSLPASGPGRYPSNGNFVLSELIVEISAIPPTQPLDFVLSRDFSATNNPSGRWGYGWVETLGGTFTALGVQHVSTMDGGATVPSWQLTTGLAPVVYKNVSTNTVSAGNGGVSFDPNEVWFYPGENGRSENFGVIRFTAPSNGLYRIETGVRPVYAGSPQGDTDFHVLKNGVELFGQFLSVTNSAAYSNTIALTSNDTLDFAIGRGADSNSIGSGLRIGAAITPAGLIVPPAVVDIVIANHSFENPVLADGQYVLNDIPGWTGMGTWFPVSNPDDSWFTGTSQNSSGSNPIDGFNAAGINNSTRLYQDLSAVWLPNHRYTLKLLMGTRKGVPFGNPTIKLISGGVVVAETSPVAPLEGAFEEYSLSYVSPVSGAILGTPIRIEIQGLGGDAQCWIENVRLSAESLDISQPTSFVMNGSFEVGSGVDSQLNSPDSTSLQGWMVSAGNIDYIGPVWAAGDGERCLDMSGTTAGTIAQTISGLTPGQTYKLSFLMAVNPNFPPPSADLRVIVGSTSNLFSMSVAGTSSNLGWQEKTAEFTASNTEAVLQFASLNQGWSGPLLDRVAVVVSTNVPPPPPPSTLIANGSFELGTSVDSQINAPNSTSIEGWTVVSGNIDYVGTSWVAGDGVRCLDLSGVTAGTISQTISGLTVGHAYRLSFLMAVNPNAPPPTTDLLVTVGGESSQFSVTTAGTANNLGWVEKTMVFVASGTEAVLVFTSLNSGWAGPVLDRVAMQSLGVPPPAPECVPPPAGIVGWWPLDGDGQDVAIGNTASFAGDPEFRAGKVGAALGFDGANDLVRIPGGAPLDVGTGAGFTIEGWINPGDLSQLRPIAEWNSNSGVGGIGVHIWTGSGNRSLVANLVDSTGAAHGFATPASLVRLGAWQHVALTYDKSSGVAVIYHDGVAAAQSNLGVFTPKTTGDLYLGNRPSGPFSGIYWRGGIDEFSVYNHALSATNVAAIYAASGTGKCGLATNAVPPWLVVQPQSQGVIKSETVSLSVVAAGSPTLQYQWRKGDVDLDGATNSTLILSNVSFSAAGAYAVVVTNDFGAITSAVANIVVNLGPTRLRVISVTTTAEGQVDLPVEMVANGNENALGFSLTFNPTLLRFVDAAPNGATPDASLIVNTNQLESGRLGLALALPAEAVFPEGVQEVVRVSFEAVSATQSAVASIGFGDQPVLRQVSDVAAVPLTATYSGGTVTIEVAGLEADVAPRPGGNNTLTVIDWVQLGRYVAALDTITSSLEFQKADSAPRATRGNGVITVSDWVQAGRYAAGLDPLRPAGGPSEPMVPLVAASGIQAASGRVLTIPATNALPRTTLALPVWLESTGNENALAFTLSFDAGNLQFIGASKAGKMSAATLNLNTNQSPAGKVGVAMALPVGTAMSAGLDSIMVFYFAVSPTATGTGAFSFGDSPVFREVADVAANSLSTTFTAASVTFGPPREVGPPLTAARSGNSILLFWPSSASGFDVYSAANPDSASWVKVPGTPVSIGGQWFMTTPISTGNQYFRLEKR